MESFSEILNFAALRKENEYLPLKDSNYVQKAAYLPIRTDLSIFLLCTGYFFFAPQ